MRGLLLFSLFGAVDAMFDQLDVRIFDWLEPDRQRPPRPCRLQAYFDSLDHKLDSIEESVSRFFSYRNSGEQTNSGLRVSGGGIHQALELDDTPGLRSGQDTESTGATGVIRQVSPEIPREDHAAVQTRPLMSFLITV